MTHITRASEQHLPEDERRQILTDAAADALAAGGTLEHADEWSRWDWLAWAAPWAFGSFLVAGPLVFIALRTFVP